MNSSTIRNIIIDFGGVLFDIDYHAPVREFEKLGFPDFASIYTQASQSPVFDKIETGKMSSDEFFDYIQTFLPNASRQSLEDAWNSILLHLWPEKVAFVQSLRDAGYRTFLFSNTNAFHVAEFEKMIDTSMGLNNFRMAFEKIYYSNAVGIKKPYPETYLQVCEWNGLNPAETLFIDDSLQHAQGAAKAGLNAVHLEPGQTIEEVLAHLLT